MRAAWFISMRDMTHTCAGHDLPLRVTATGWRRPIGCLKLHVIFRKRASNYRAVLWKMTYKDKASYGTLPPCMIRTCGMTHQYMRHDAFVGEAWLVVVCAMVHSYMWHDSCIYKYICKYVYTYNYVYTLTHTYIHIYHWFVWHDSFTYLPWLIVRGVTHSCVRKDPCMCNVTHSHVWCDSFMCVAGLSTVTHPTRETRHTH